MWSGFAAIQTSVSQAMSAAYLRKSPIERNAVTYTRSAEQLPRNDSISRCLLGETGPCDVTASIINSHCFVRIVENDIRQLVVLRDRHAQPGELVAVENDMLLGGIADIEHGGTWCKAGTELLDDRHLQRVVLTRRQIDRRSVGQTQRDAMRLPQPIIGDLQCAELLDECLTASSKAGVP